MAGINIFPQDLDTTGKTVLLRLDLNVPIKNSIIQDHTRIEQILPFVKKLIEKKTKIIIITHLGRPKGIRDGNFSLKPVFDYLTLQYEEDKVFKEGGYLSNSLLERIQFEEKLFALG